MALVSAQHSARATDCGALDKARSTEGFCFSLDVRSASTIRKQTELGEHECERAHARSASHMTSAHVVVHVAYHHIISTVVVLYAGSCSHSQASSVSDEHIAMRVDDTDDERRERSEQDATVWGMACPLAPHPSS